MCIYKYIHIYGSYFEGSTLYIYFFFFLPLTHFLTAQLRLVLRLRDFILHSGSRFVLLHTLVNQVLCLQRQRLSEHFQVKHAGSPV